MKMSLFGVEQIVNINNFNYSKNNYNNNNNIYYYYYYYYYY